MGLLIARRGEQMDLPGASRHGLNFISIYHAASRLPACSWVERSPEAALLCHVFILRFGSGLEGISEPWGGMEGLIGAVYASAVNSMWNSEGESIAFGQGNSN